MLLLDTDEITTFAPPLPGAVGLAPVYRIYDAGDGWLAIATDGDKIESLCRRLQVRSDDLAVAINGLGVEKALVCMAELGIDAEAIDPDPEREFFTRQANRDAGLINEWEHPTFGTVAHPFGYWDFESLACVRGVPAPLLGQHSTAVLDELGLSDLHDGQ